MQQLTRLEQRWKSPRFLSSNLQEGKGPFFFKTFFEFQREKIYFFCHTDSYGTIKSLFYHTSLKEIFLAVLDVYVELALGRKRRDLFIISAREIENYLRDDNKKQVFTVSPPMEELLETASHQLAEKVGVLLFSGGRVVSFDSFSKLMDKIEAVEYVLESCIRPLLRVDGGDIELIDIQGNEIFLSFLGTCRSCPASSGGTGKAVESIFKEKLLFSSIKLLAE